MVPAHPDFLPLFPPTVSFSGPRSNSNSLWSTCLNVRRVKSVRGCNITYQLLFGRNSKINLMFSRLMSCCIVEPNYREIYTFFYISIHTLFCWCNSWSGLSPPLSIAQNFYALGFFLFTVVTIVTVLTLATIISGKVWLALTSSVEECIGPVVALVLPVELLVMTVSTVPPANSQFLALSTVSIATTWLMVAVWFRAARLVFQAFKVHTNFRKLTLYPRQTSNGDKKTYHSRGHLSYPRK